MLRTAERNAERARERAETTAKRADAIIEALVTEARRQGHTWAEIAASLGVNRSTAFRRYRHLEPKQDGGSHAADAS